MLMLGRKPVSPLCMPYAGFEKATNCMLEIPQNLKLEIDSSLGVVIKAGSVITLDGSTYSTYTATKDFNITTPGTGRRVILMRKDNYTFLTYQLSNIVSGDTDSKAGQLYHVWFDTANKEIKAYTTSGDTVAFRCSYPLCIIDVDSNNNISFAKDANGNDMIFNGAGFIGHHAFVYPGVSGLTPAGINNNGDPISYTGTTYELRIYELKSTTNFITITNGGISQLRNNYREVNTLDTIVSCQYLKPENLFYFYTGSDYVLRYETPLLFYTLSNNIVTNFTIQQPLTRYRWVVKLVP